MDTLTATVRDTGEGEVRWFCGGGVMTWKANSAETGGAFTIWEDVMDRGKVTPLQLHPEADETYYLLEGEILLHIDGQERRVGPGGIAVLPRGVPHAFMVTSPQAKMLCFQNPAGGEAFYLDASEPMTKGDRRTGRHGPDPRSRSEDGRDRDPWANRRSHSVDDRTTTRPRTRMSSGTRAARLRLPS